ncbi:hypothetical protein [Enteractinococcus helveticum]|uniref:Uncharacterized protein n=1 Tax=Enteractinococcus helveticum TaxID=1837282 RepID=A0A1B7LZH5_9MICC|nr:hypothetical protein [Enteractinococcus helveticum]OAV60924.1 hypothetical protein A6F49_10670 [Enteractinococcus helveticum]
MRRRIMIGLGILVALAGLLVVMLMGIARGWNLGGIVWMVLSCLFIIGLTVRCIRAAPGRRMRETFGPIVDAGDVYQKHLMGRPTAQESLYEASKLIPRDKYSSEERPER